MINLWQITADDRLTTMAAICGRTIFKKANPSNVRSFVDAIHRLVMVTAI